MQVGSTCGPSTLWRSEVAVPVVRRCFSHVCSVSLMVTPGCSFPTSWRSGMLGACVVRLWSHVVAPVFRELLCLGGCVPRSSFTSVLLEFLLLWLGLAVAGVRCRTVVVAVVALCIASSVSCERERL
ncbi:hypothetical protein Taro_038964 [Colocasia esculenta]|uniref:Uncharacterized protein n=1 Tax=Colocasia esculenta TaxID=4460 RepID=A0A843WQ56_COLES|nr:hypothetical protein [Colocasia esculenta]